MNFGKNWLIGFYQYAQQHDGQFPTNFAQAAPFVPADAKNQKGTATSSVMFPPLERSSNVSGPTAVA
jgi:hypothetical protein